MKIIRNRILPIGKDFSAINLFGILFVKHNVPLTASLVNHEKIHTAQMRELLFVPFYVVYVIEWLFLLIKFRGDSFKAYRNISFEKEAYRFSEEKDYLNKRQHFNQWKNN